MLSLISAFKMMDQQQHKSSNTYFRLYPHLTIDRGLEVDGLTSDMWDDSDDSHRSRQFKTVCR